MYCTSCNNSLHSTEIYFCKDMPYCQYCSPWRKEYVSILPKTIRYSDSSINFKNIIENTKRVSSYTRRDSNHRNVDSKHLIIKGALSIVIYTYFCVRLSSST